MVATEVLLTKAYDSVAEVDLAVIDEDFDGAPKDRAFNEGMDY